ncbi:alpha/beta hydrolase [Canibacter sp. lx-72]|uniref:alpha/beta hydrolase n=1 Tax=Canibacter zhuwentaonis TaxID=2837491 RepID=UPI001BDC2BC8|nr:alpha/beta hydrolase [Canibacter zhuwentaonis]MBT1018676.1 alpha/beta hydrolase [Canibacter zhuwentaonis]
MQKSKSVKSKICAAIAGGSALALFLSGCARNQLSDVVPPVVDKTVDYTKQEITWGSCPNTNLATPRDAECAYIEAPLDWSKPEAKEAVKLQLTKLPSKSENPKGTIFANPGGPGASGVNFVLGSAQAFEQLRETYDIVGWAPRGVEASSAVKCYTNQELDESLYGNEKTPEPGTQAWLNEVHKSNKELSERCESYTGSLYKHVGTRSTVQDLNLMRELVGDAKLNYIGLSYGTYIGARYAEMFPQHVGKVVLDGALKPDADASEVIAVQTKGFENALKNYWKYCVSVECSTEKTVADGMKMVSKLLADVKVDPIKAADGRWVTDSVLLTAIVTPLYSENMWPLLEGLFQSVKNRDTGPALDLADQYHNRVDGKYTDNSNSAFTAINCADYPPQQPDLAAMRADAAKLAQDAPVFGPYQGYGGVSCWGWQAAGDPQRAKPISAPGAEPILVIGTTGDPATPYEWAEDLAAQLESASLITYVGEGHVAFGRSSCVTQKVTEFFNGAPAAPATCTQ